MLPDITNPHDRFFRASMADHRVAREFLESHLPAHILKHIDWNVLEICPDTFVDEELKLSQSDVVIKTKIAGKTGYIYLLLEHQSTVDHSMPLRLLKYMVKIWEHYKGQKKVSAKTVFPVIAPLVFYTGAKPYTGKYAMWDLCGEHAELMRSIISHPFTLIDVNAMTEEQLKHKQYAGTMGFVMRHQFRKHFEEQLNHIIDNIVRLAVDSQDGFLLKLLHYILIVDETHDTVQSLLTAIHDKAPRALRGNIMGLAEKIYHDGEEKGLQKGMHKREIDIAQNMLKEGVEIPFIAKITGLSIETIKKMQSAR